MTMTPDLVEHRSEGPTTTGDRMSKTYRIKPAEWRTFEKVNDTISTNPLVMMSVYERTPGLCTWFLEHYSGSLIDGGDADSVAEGKQKCEDAYVRYLEQHVLDESKEWPTYE